MEENVTLTLVKRCRMSNSSELFSYKLYTLSMLNFQVADTHTHTRAHTHTHAPSHTHTLATVKSQLLQETFFKKGMSGPEK